MTKLIAACNHCGSQIRFDIKHTGRTVHCPQCKSNLTLSDYTDSQDYACFLVEAKRPADNSKETVNEKQPVVTQNLSSQNHSESDRLPSRRLLSESQERIIGKYRLQSKRTRRGDGFSLRSACVVGYIGLPVKLLSKLAFQFTAGCLLLRTERFVLSLRFAVNAHGLGMVNIPYVR